MFSVLWKKMLELSAMIRWISRTFSKNCFNVNGLWHYISSRIQIVFFIQMYQNLLKSMWMSNQIIITTCLNRFGTTSTWSIYSAVRGAFSMGCLVGWLVLYKKRTFTDLIFYYVAFSFDKQFVLNNWNNQIGSNNRNCNKKSPKKME